MQHMRTIGALLIAATIFGFGVPLMAAERALPNMADQCYAPTRKLTTELRKAFVEEVSALAIQAENKHGVPAPILAAMSINESGYGTTQLALAAHNVLSYKWNGDIGPAGRKLFVLTCQPKEDSGNIYVVFKDRADSADFTANKLATSKYYKAATLAYKDAVASGEDKETAAKNWFKAVAPTYNPYHSDEYIAAIFKTADDPIRQSGTRDGTSNLWGLVAAPARLSPSFAGHEANVAAVAKAQKAAYAIRQSTNGCPAPSADLLGWPAKELKECEYSVGPKASPRTAHVVLLDVPAEKIATWIERACSKQLPGISKCFDTVLRCGRNNSGMMFAVSGNMMEDMDGVHWKNYFFRNGMTVSIDGERNGTTEQIDMNRQRELTAMANLSISSIPSGRTRFWRTNPSQFATLFPSEGSPSKLASSSDRQRWLDATRTELLAALKNNNNRLLEAWIAASAKALTKGACPND